MTRDLLVLCYHAVSPTWDADLSVTPEALERQLAALARRGYRGATFSGALAGDGEGRVVAVTFDDAYLSVLELAKPLLDRYGFPATIFVPTDWPDRARPMAWEGIDDWLATPHEPELRPLDWEQLRGLAAHGWEIGSHTCSHPHLPELADADLERELRESKKRVESELDAECASLAYPYGSVDERVVRATGGAGYRWACTIPRMLEKPRPLSWPRAAIYHGDDARRFAAKVSPTLRRLRSARLGALLDRLRVTASERA